MEKEKKTTYVSFDTTHYTHTLKYARYVWAEARGSACARVLGV